MTELKKTAIENMAYHLQGTCENAEHYQINHGLFPLTTEEQDYMDELIMQCPDCGYWFKPHDLIDGQCEDCYEEELEMIEQEEDEDD